ncbi:hypothetical protein BT67DRAFT_290742 [Trichocladium antarcticum]|uniref:C2H2-type domain-containing protein n=1 Tax=Trichocladium antarcticum TaxID=1450529 RepID=A0AAN6UL61_9PEZI|nr:hypothetical protein BT67DRAFT_290742 [Trichocladium antarcticum]
MDRPPSSPGRSRRQSTAASTARNQSPSRKTCRRCGQQFQTRNKLMRHLFDSHTPPKPSHVGAKTAAKTAAARDAAVLVSPPSGPRPPDPPASRPARPPRVHPFSMLSQQGQIAFTLNILCLIFAVGLKQQEQEQEQQEHAQTRPETWSTTPGSHHPARWSPHSPSSQTPSSQTPSPQLGTAGAESRDQIYAAGPVDSSEFEDSDDDGGVAISGTMLGDLVVRVRWVEDDLDHLD